MQRLRSARLVRLVVLLVSAGTFGVAVRSVEAAPGARYRAWLLGQVRAERAALVRAALDAMSGTTATPSLFLSRYAEAQLSAAQRGIPARPASPGEETGGAVDGAAARPTGAWFGHPELSFLDALALLEGRLRTFDAPAASVPSVATLVVPPSVPSSGSAPLPVAAFAAADRVPAPASSTRPCGGGGRGVPRAVLHGASAAQPCGP